MRTERGGGLLELLLALGVFMSALPFAYNFAMNQKERAENARISEKIKIVQSALEQYVADNKQKFLAPVSANVARVRLADLDGIDAADFKDAKIQLRVVKSRDSAGRAFVQGIVVFDSPRLSPLRTRQISAMGGNAAGFADGRMLYGSFGTWRAPASKIGDAATAHSVLARTRPFRGGGDYLHRLPSTDPLDATMRGDLDLGGHNINDAKNIGASGARFFDTLTATAVETSKMTVSNRLDWTAPIDVFGDALVMGAITSDGRTAYARDISVAGRSQFRSVAADELAVDNLYLSGLSVAPADGTPAVLSVSGSLDMIRGHVRAVDAFVGFSGSVAPKLVVGTRIEDAADPSYYWDMESGDAALGDVQLTNLPQIIRGAFAREKTGKTETERLMGSVVQNSNATAADYLRALDMVRRMVERKYGEIADGLR